MKKTLKSGYGRQPPQHFQFVLNISSSVVKIKLHTKNQDLEDDLNNISNLFSIFILVWLEPSYMLKISLLACLILEMAMKKTLKSGFGRRPPHNSSFFLLIQSSLVRVNSHTKNQPPSLAILYFPGWVGGWVAGEIEIKANSARLG